MFFQKVTHLPLMSARLLIGAFLYGFAAGKSTFRATRILTSRQSLLLRQNPICHNNIDSNNNVISGIALPPSPPPFFLLPPPPQTNPVYVTDDNSNVV